jgi:hypothetical protein
MAHLQEQHSQPSDLTRCFIVQESGILDGGLARPGKGFEGLASSG